MMKTDINLKDYFENTRGLGVLATADSKGDVDVAVYSRPHVFNPETIAFIMADKRSHQNLQSNPKAAYLFREDAAGYRGKRIYITKTEEVKNSPLISELRRKKRDLSEDDDGKDRFLVYFRITDIRPLTGDTN
jgi:Pyridoxamine 5'-phosphate oxidase